MLQEVKNRSKIISKEHGTVGPIRWFKIKFWELFLYLSEVLMSKNKYVALEKYHYKKLFNSWDDSIGSDY